MDKQNTGPRGFAMRRRPVYAAGEFLWASNTDDGITTPGITDKVIENVSESVSAVGNDVTTMTPVEIASKSHIDGDVTTYTFSDDDDIDSSVQKPGHIAKSDALSDVGEREKFKVKQQSHGERARKMNLMIAISVLSMFMVVVMFVTAILQIENTFILTANENYELPETEYLTVNRVYDEYKTECSVSISFEGGEPFTATLPPITVSELVEHLYPELESGGKQYEFSHASDTIIKDGMTLEINAVEYVVKTVVESYPFGVVNNEVQTIPKGKRVVTQPGVNGSVERDYKEKYVNGVLSDTIIEATRVLKEPVPELANVGVGGTFVNKKGKSIEYSYYIDVLASAYGVDTGYGGDLAYTYTGTLARPGVIAVDPEVIPFDSVVYLVGEGGNMDVKYGDMGKYFYAEDAGNAIIGERIDIYMGDDLDSQMKFGKRNMRAYILALPETE